MEEPLLLALVRLAIAITAAGHAVVVQSLPMAAFSFPGPPHIPR
jgi:hypothetical protein